MWLVADTLVKLGQSSYVTESHIRRRIRIQYSKSSIKQSVFLPQNYHGLYFRYADCIVGFSGSKIFYDRYGNVFGIGAHQCWDRKGFTHQPRVESPVFVAEY